MKKKMEIFEPAMCCPTGVCGPAVDKELLRLSTVINNLKENGSIVERYNLTSNPQKFVDNEEINRLLNDEGVEVLPVTVFNGVVVKTKTYPTNEEIFNLLGVSAGDLVEKKTSKGCGCEGGCC